MQSNPQGVIVVDKPADISSAKTVAMVKKIFGARKTGHAGTLDPFATGVLVCCLNQATRLARFFLAGPKTYGAVLHLGISTDTQDFTGRTIAQGDPEGLSATQIRRVARRFEGERFQAPPVFSALKHQGKPLYAWARSGRPVQKAERAIRIERLEVLEIRLPEVHFEVVCSSGTYVRTLCADMGAALGCGGHLKSLRRLASSGFGIQEAVSLEELEQLAADDSAGSRVISMADALRDMPAWRVHGDLSAKIRHGGVLLEKEIPSGVLEAPGGVPEGRVKILDSKGRLLAVVQSRPQGERLEYCCVFN